MNNILLQNHENNIRLLIRKFETIKFDEIFFVYDHDLKYNVDENSEREIENDEKNDDNDASCERKKSKRIIQKKIYLSCHVKIVKNVSLIESSVLIDKI